METEELKDFMRELIQEEFCPNPLPLGAKWKGGQLILKPGIDGQSKEIPLDVFFKKIIMIRENLRVLEQKINNHPNLEQEEKITLEGYITKCYGTLTSFNILFKDDKDRFVGAATPKEAAHEVIKASKGGDRLSVEEAKQKLGIKEYGRS